VSALDGRFGNIAVGGTRKYPLIIYELEDASHAEELAYILEAAGRPLGDSSIGDVGWQQDARSLFDALAYLEEDDD